MTESSVKLALQAISHSLASGRRIMFVLGAGASVASRIPLMTDVYERLAKLCSDMPKKDESLNYLASDLKQLAAGHAARSTAAKALGTLQSAGRAPNLDPYHTACAEVWSKFSQEFVEGKINSTLRTASTPAAQSFRFSDICQDGEFTGHLASLSAGQTLSCAQGGPLYQRMPTRLHSLAAAFAITQKAFVVSLNFDGLTRSAINRSLQEDTGRRGVVASTVQAVERFFVGSSSGDSVLYPVFKVWGDVFHTVCVNNRCPEFEVRTPIYALGEQPSTLECPSCARDRQLEIYFAGYEEKEMQSQFMLCELLRYALPQIGCIVTVGVSGLWDSSLLRFLSTICDSIETDNTFGEQVGHLPSCVCVDPFDSHLVDDLSRRRHIVEHIKMTGDEFADLFIGTSGPQQTEKTEENCPPPSEPIRHYLHDDFWSKQMGSTTNEKTELHLPALARDTYCSLRKQDDQNYLLDLASLQQLGIKTRLCASEANLIAQHNRHNHSLGATTLAALWLQAIHSNEFPQELKARLTDCGVEPAKAILAVRHHDVGHLPFTHLMEEIFDELHWGTRSWGKPFKHDEPVLFGLEKALQKEIEAYFASGDLRGLRDKTRPFAGIDDNDAALFLLNSVERYNQGCSGFPWIDCIINSPLDVDKLDYVFRDCHYLKQGLHIRNEERNKWMQDFFSGIRVLPSGMTALSGSSGERAREFLEERVWLYKHTYFRTAFRALETLARMCITQWLLARTTSKLGEQMLLSDSPVLLEDTRAKKGQVARELVWDLVRNAKTDKSDPNTEPAAIDECYLLDKMISQTIDSKSNGLPFATVLVEWLGEAKKVFNRTFAEYGDGIDGLLDYISGIGVVTSERVYVHLQFLKKARELVRQLENEHPCSVLFDVAVLPRTLSYPEARRTRYSGNKLICECFVVPSKDPDKWHRETSHWVPLSMSRFSDWDNVRWGAIMAVALDGDSRTVRHGMDRLRQLFRNEGVEFQEEEPRFK